MWYRKLTVLVLFAIGFFILLILASLVGIFMALESIVERLKICSGYKYNITHNLIETSIKFIGFIHVISRQLLQNPNNQ